MSSNEKFEREFEAFLNEEDSRLAALYRKLPQTDPDARLDAAVHSMAQRALNPQRVATPQASIARRRVGRWVPALGAAAGIVLAAGVAFRLGPSLNDANYRDAAPANDVISVRPTDAPTAASAPPLASAPPPVVSAPASATAAARAQPAAQGNALAPPAPAPAQKAAAVEEQEKSKLSSSLPDEPHAVAPGAGGAAKAAPKPRPAPQAFPAETRAARQSPEIDAVESKQITATGARQNLHDRDTQNNAAMPRERSLDDKADAGAAAPAATHVAKPAAAPAASPPAAMATAPAATEPSTAKDAGPAPADRSAAPLREAAPPPPPARETPSTATTAEIAVPQAAGSVRREDSANQAGGALKKERAKSADPNARLYPEHWLANIRTMLAENRRDEALKSLAEFRRMYPDYRLPDDLRDVK